MTNPIGKFVWFESASRDPRKAQAFYGELFGWKVEGMPMGPDTYEMIKVGDKAIGGYVKLEDKDPRPAHWTSYLASPDVDAGLAAAKAAGAKVAVEAFDVPTVGRMGGILDPQGAALMLYRPDGDGMTDDPPAPGHFCWNELWVPDPAAAVAFYEKAFGFTHRDVDMGPQGTYRILAKDGKDRGGVTSAPKGVPSMWLPYVAVEDCDAVVARTGRLGGKVVVGATDIPNVGRFAVLQDPQGAAFACLKGMTGPT